MDINKTAITEDLEKILTCLQNFKTKNPEVFRHLCNEVIATGDMSLGDAESALISAITEVSNNV